MPNLNNMPNNLPTNGNLPDIAQIISQLQALLQSRELQASEANKKPLMQQALLQDIQASPAMPSPAMPSPSVSSPTLPNSGSASDPALQALAQMASGQANSSDSFLNQNTSLSSIDEYDLQDYQNPSLAKEMLDQVNSILNTDRAAFLQIAFKHKLSKEQAQGFYLDMAELLVKSLQDDAASVDIEAICTSLWPQDTAKEIDIARRGANYVGIGDELDSTSLSFNPLVLKLAHAVGSFLTEDNYQSGAATSFPSSTGQAAYDEMLNLIATEAYQRNDPSTIKKVEHLSKRVTLGV